MPWLETILDRLAEDGAWSYHRGGQAATEPTALAALALLAHGRSEKARRAIDWITRAQAPDGAVGVTARERTPCWPTALAMLAWQAWDSSHSAQPYKGCIERAVRWSMRARGDALAQSPLVGHNMTLTGWPWVLGTHSWLEPTAYFVLALKATGHATHPRTREAVRLLIDRLLPSGGCNCGNTTYMGQELLPHVLPTGLALLALAGESRDDPRIERSLTYLERTLPETSALASLSFGLMGLAAHDRRPAAADVWLKTAAAGELPFGPRAFTDALAALAALPRQQNPLLVPIHPSQPAGRKEADRS